MAINNLDLLELLRTNPEAKIFKADNILYIDTGKDKIAISVASNRMNLVLQDVPNTPVSRITDGKLKESLRSYTYSNTIPIPKLPRNITNPNPHIDDGQRRRNLKKTVNFTDVTGISINNLVNDFFVSFYNPKSKLYGKSLSEAFKVFSKYKKATLDSKDIAIDTSVWAQVEKLHRAIHKDKALNATIADSIKSTLVAKLQPLDANPELQFTAIQNVLESKDGRLLVFTNKELTDKATSKIGTAFEKVYGQSKRISVVTPKGTRQVFGSSDGNMLVDGFSVPRVDYDKFAILSHINIAKRPVADFEDYYKHKQAIYKPLAVKELNKLAAKALANKHPEDIDRILADTTVGDLKRITANSALGLNPYLKKYTLNDLEPLNSVVDIDLVKNSSYNREINNLAKVFGKKAKSVVKDASSLGIDEEAITIDVENLTGHLFSDSMTNAERFEAWGKRTEVLNQIQETIFASKTLNPYATKVQQRVNSYRRKNPGKIPGIDFKALVENLRSPDGVKKLKESFFLDPTLANPLLNLEGNIKQGNVEKIQDAMIKSAKGGDTRPYNQEAISALGQLLSKDSLDGIEKTFFKKVYKDSYKLKGTAQQDTRMDIIDAGYNLEDAFGGRSGISDIFQAIRGGKHEKEMQASTEAFKYDMSRTDDSDKLLDESLNTVMEQLAEQRSFKTKNPEKFQNKIDLGELDLTEMSSDKILAHAKDQISSGFGIEDKKFDTAHLRERINVYNNRLNNKSFNLVNYDDMMSTAAEYGITDAHKYTEKDLLGLLTKEYNKRATELHPDLKMVGSKVRVNLTKSLFLDLARQNKDSNARVSNENLNLVKFMGENKADWIHLMEAYENNRHGGLAGKVGSTQFIFGPKKEAKEYKDSIRGMLSLAPKSSIDMAKFNQLDDLYKSNTIYTNRDEVLHDSLEKAIRYDKGKPYLSNTFDVNDAMSTALLPYNRPDKYIAKPGKQPFGKEAFGKAETVFFEEFFNTYTHRVAQKSALTMARKREALKFVDEANLVDEFQTTKLSEVASKAEQIAIARKLDYSIDNFVNRQVGRFYPDIHLLDTIKKGAKNKVLQYVENMLTASENGKLQTSNSYMAGIKALYNITSREQSKKSLKFMEYLVSNPSTALNRVVMGKASSYMGDVALRFANIKEAELIQGNEPIKKLKLLRNINAAEDIKADLLDYKSVGYKSPNKVNISDWLKGQNNIVDEVAAAEEDKIIEIEAKSMVKARRRMDRLNKHAWPKTITDAEGNEREYKVGKAQKLDYKEPYEEKFIGSETKWFSKDPEPQQIGIPQKGIDVWKRIPWSRRYKSDILTRPSFFSNGTKIPGNSRVDNVPALLSKGEVVVDTPTSEKLGIHTQADYERFKKAVHQGKVGHFSDGTVIDPNDYIEKPYPGTGNKIQWEMKESARVDKNIISSLALDNSYVTMNVADSKIRLAFDTASSLDSGINDSDILKAKTNYGNQKIGKIAGLTPESIKELMAIGNVDMELKPHNASQETVNAINNLGGEAIKNLFDTLDLNGIESKDFKKGVRGVRRAWDPTNEDSTKFMKSLKELSHDAELLGRMFNTTADVFKDIDKLPKSQAVGKLIEFAKSADTSIPSKGTGALSVGELTSRKMAISSLVNALGDKAFGTEVRTQEGGFRAARDQISSAESLKMHADTRISEFGSLLMQNAAFGASYAIIGAGQQAFSSTVGFVSDFSDAMKNLQAITGDSTDGLKIMSQSVKQVSTETKFGAIEIAEAATILGQAGFTAVDISKSLEGVVQLATGTGSKLEDSTQILTSTLTIWDKSLTDSKKTANEFTAAINKSKLDVDSLTKAIQYSGNIAAEAGISSTDVVTMTSLLKDAGIKQGSTLGTGQRLLYGDIASPSAKFAASLKSVGIELEQFKTAFDSEGIYGALKLMKDAGYGLAAASRGMEVREKSIYVAAINQLDKFKPLRADITGTNAAYIANKTQMEGIGNAFKNMANSWQISLNDSFEGYNNNVVGLIKNLTIDTKPLANNNTAIEGNTLEKATKPVNESTNFSITAAGVAASSLAAYKLGAGALSNYANSLPVSLATRQPIAEKGLSEGLVKFNSLLTKTTENSVFKLLASPIGKTAGLSLAFGGTAAALAPENSKIAAGSSAIGGVLSYMAADTIVKKLGEAPNSSLKPGSMKAIGTTLALSLAADAVDQFIAAPLVESDNLGKRLAGTVVRGASWAGQGALLGSTLGPGGTTAGGIIGGIAGVVSGTYSKKEAPTVTMSVALAKIANDAKTLNSEVNAISKAAINFKDASNFALRITDKVPKTETEAQALDIEKKEKLLLGAKEATALTESLKTIRKVVGGDFNVAGIIAATPSTAEQATDAQRERAKQQDRALPSIADNRYEINVYRAEGNKVVSSIELYEGQAADAFGKSYSSLASASFKALNAEGGGVDRMFSQLSGRGYKDFEKEIGKAKTPEERTATTEKFTSNIRSIASDTPALSLKHFDELLNILIKVGKASKDEVNKAYDDKKAWFSGAETEDNIRDRKEELKNIDLEIESTKASFESLRATAGARASTSAESLAIGESQIQSIMAKQNLSFKDAYKQYINSSEAVVTREGYTTNIKQETAIKSMSDKLLDGKNQLQEINKAGLILTRDMTKQAADGIANIDSTLGGAMTEMAINVSKDLIPAMTNIKKSLRASMSSFGDLTGTSIEDLVNKEGVSLIDKKTFDKYTSGDKYTKESDLTVDTNNMLNVTRVNTTQLKENSKALTNLYLEAKNLGKSFVDTVLSFNSLDDAIATGDLGLVQATDNLLKQLKSTGISGLQAFRSMDNIGQVRDSQLAGINIDDFRALFTDDRLVELDNSKSRAIRDKKTDKTNALRDIETNKSRSQEDLNISFENSLENIALNAERAYEDLAINMSRALEDIAIKFDRGIQDININYARGKEDIALSGVRGAEDIAIKTARGFEDIALSSARGTEDIQTSKIRGLDKIELIEARSIEDLNINYARAIEDTKIKEEDTTNSIELARTRNIEDAYTNFSDNIAKLTRGLQYTTDAIERSRQDTIDMFERSLNKPQVVTLNPESLLTIANNLGDVSLALDAHKAALAANTTAVLQNVALQQSQEDVAKDAYKDAYKKVGGQVYNDDGTINESFVTAYNDYMAKNSEALIDAVLEQALNRAFAGVGFNITDALNNPEYLAGNVAAPTPAMTTPGAIAGSGLTVDQLITALYDVKSGEVRVTTTAGVILEAQGGMEGALFDLETAFIELDIKIREASIDFETNVTEAGISLANNLRDIEIAYQRNLEDLTISLATTYDSISTMLARGMEDITLNTTRSMQDLNTSLIQATEDLATKLGRAGEDLNISAARAAEDLALSLARAHENLSISTSRAMEDLARSTAQAYQDVMLSQQRAAEDIERERARAIDNLLNSVAKVQENIDLNYNRNIEDLETKISDAMAAINQSYADSLVSFYNSAASWVSSIHDQLNAGAASSIWDASKAIASMQSQFNVALSNFKIDSELIVRNIGTSFKTALESPALKALITEGFGPIVDAFKTGFTNLNVTTSKTMLDVGKAMEASFNDNLAKPLKAIADTTKESTSSINNSMNNMNTTFSSSATTMTTSADKLKIANTNIVDTTTKIATDITTGATNITNATTKLEPIGPNLAGVGVSLQDAATKLALAAYNATNISTNAVLGLSGAIEGVGYIIADAAITAINTINAAVARAVAAAAAVPLEKSTGGPIAGYGGGDIVPLMAEPGEFIFRKEVVRALGVEKLIALNSGATQSLGEVTAIGLPSNGGSSISVNMNVQAGSSIELIERNIERIADGVKKVFLEYS